MKNSNSYKNSSLNYSLFVGCLPTVEKEEVILEYFLQYGGKQKLRFFYKDSKRLGYAVLKVSEFEVFSLLISTTHYLGGRKLVVREDLSGQRQELYQKNLSSRRVILKDIPKKLKDSELKIILERKFGLIDLLYTIPDNSRPGKLKGYANFISADSSRSAVVSSPILTPYNGEIKVTALNTEGDIREEILIFRNYSIPSREFNNLSRFELTSRNRESAISNVLNRENLELEMVSNQRYEPRGEIAVGENRFDSEQPKNNFLYGDFSGPNILKNVPSKEKKLLRRSFLVEANHTSKNIKINLSRRAQNPTSYDHKSKARICLEPLQRLFTYC